MSIDRYPRDRYITLCKALQAELLLGRKMLKIKLQEQSALKSNDVLQIQELVLLTKDISNMQTDAAVHRIRCAQRMALSLGHPESATSLKTLAGHLIPGDERQLLQIRDEILTLDDKLHRIGLTNRSLLESALDYIRFSLQAIADVALRPAKYGFNPNIQNTPTFYIDQKC